ncbi:MAG: HEAT repeat domain-containing protein [Planctomycetota bacterium]|nr:HEAT repeat domain-containing protein [Planctomycetota bacterium]
MPSSLLWFGIAIAVIGIGGGSQDPLRRIAVLEDARSLGKEGELIGLLSHGDPRVRARACVALGRIQVPEAIIPLRGRLKDPDLTVKKAAAFALGQTALGRPEAASPGGEMAKEVVRTLITLAREAEPDLRALAADALGKIGGEDSLQALRSIVGDKDPETRRQAAYALGRIRSSKGAEALQGLLDDSSPKVRAAAAYALGRVEDPLPIDALRKAVNDPDPDVRFAAYQGMRRGRDVAGIPLYVEMIGEKDPRVLVEVLWGLAAAPTEGRVKIKKMLEHKDSPDVHVRSALARALIKAKSDEVAATLLELSEDPSPMVRAEVAAAQGRYDSDLGAAIDLAADPHFYVRAAVATALRSEIVRLREEIDRLVERALVTRLEDKMESLERARRLSSSPLWSGASTNAPGAKRLQEILDDPAEKIRIAAARAAADLPLGAGLPQLFGMLSDEDPWVRAEAALSVRLRHAGGPRVAVEDLPEPAGRILEADLSGDAQALLDALSSCIVEREPRARAFAARALELAGPGAEEIGRQALNDPDGFVVRFTMRSLIRSSGDREGLEMSLASIARSSDARTRAELAWLLPEVEAEWASKLLLALTDDSDDGVRQIAIRHLAWATGSEPAPEVSLDDDTRRACFLLVIAGRAWRAIGKLAADPDVVVQASALEGLGLVPTRSAEARLRAAVTSADPGVAFAGAHHLRSRPASEAVALLVKAYKTWMPAGYQDVRIEVVRALAAIRGDRVRPTLEAAAADPDPAIREEARLGLRDRGWEIPEEKPVPGHEPSRYLQERAPLPRSPRVVMEMEKGEIRMELYPDAAPIHVRNFLRLTREGFYDGLTIHRVVPNFVIQGGDPLGTGWGYSGDLLRDEINTIRYTPGTLGMPKSGKDTGGCQLFLTHVSTPWLDGAYTAFGRVTAGLDILDKIEVGDRIVKMRLESEPP